MTTARGFFIITQRNKRSAGAFPAVFPGKNNQKTIEASLQPAGSGEIAAGIFPLWRCIRAFSGSMLNMSE
jgi:hypothetical protein